MLSSMEIRFLTMMVSADDEYKLEDWDEDDEDKLEDNDGCHS